MIEGIPSLWDDHKASGMSEPELLLYRSNLLGADLRVTNYGGGNTSAKIAAKDPLTGATVTVLWVKGSGGDLGSMKLDGFSTLYLEKLEHLKRLYRGLAHEDEMVGYLPHCNFNMNPRAASIDTPLHAFIPKAHVDHMHPDAVIAIAAAARSKELTAGVCGAALTPLSATERQRSAAELMPLIRGKISAKQPKVGHFNDSPEVLEFVCARDLDALAALG